MLKIQKNNLTPWWTYLTQLRVRTTRDINKQYQGLTNTNEMFSWGTRVGVMLMAAGKITLQ